MEHIPVILQINYKLPFSEMGHEIQYMYVATDLPCVHWRKITDIQCSAVTTPWPVLYYHIVS